jgi:glycosyltransferase involved in cell wall biosynthesis
MKRILLITLDFPPYKGRGNVMRILKFAKYLPDFGWQPTVLSEKKQEREDESLGAQLSSDVRTIYVGADTPRKKKQVFKKHLSGNDELAWWKRLAYLFYRSVWYNLHALYRNYLMAPDQHRQWSREASRMAEMLHRRHPFDVFLTSGPPFSTVATGLKLKRRLQIPWILDFRDGWVGNPLYNQRKRIVIQWRNKCIERKAISRSDTILFATEPLREIYRNRYPDRVDQMITIENGYDTEDFEHIENNNRDDHHLHILYSGSIGGKRNTESFLSSVTEVVAQNREIGEVLRITFLGKFGKRRERWLNRLPGVLQIQDHLPHRDALTRMADADVFLLIAHPHQGGRTIMTGKIFEYLYFQKPIFSVSHRCAATDLIQDLKIGYVADHESKEEIKTRIHQIYEDWKHDRLPGKIAPDILAQYDRRSLTQKLSRRLDMLNASVPADGHDES